MYWNPTENHKIFEICENLYCDERYIASILDKILSGGELINSEDRKGCVNVTCNDSKGSSNHVGWSGNQQNSVEFDMHCNEEKEEEHARKSYQSLVFLRELFFLSRLCHSINATRYFRLFSSIQRTNCSRLFMWLY